MAIDFALERARALAPDSHDGEYLLEISWLYDRIVKSGSHTPVPDLSYELVLPLNFVAECIRNSMERRLLKKPARGSYGGELSQQALRKLRQLGNHR